MQLLPATHPLITFFTIAVMIDFVIAIPFIFYERVLRQQVAGKSILSQLIRLIPIVFLGYLIVSYLIPNTNSDILTITRNLLISLELFVVGYEFYKVYKITQFVRQERSVTPHAIDALRSGLNQALEGSRVASYLTHDAAVWYYCVFSWRTKPYSMNQPSNRTYSYHRESSLIVMSMIVIKLVLLEGVALHVLLYLWSPIVAWVSSVGHVYLIILLIAELRASFLNPTLIQESHIRIRQGLQICTDIDYNNIAQIEIAEEFTVDKAMKKNSMVPLFPKPNVHIHCTEPQNVVGYFGVHRQVTDLYLYVDESKRFQYEVRARLFHP